MASVGTFLFILKPCLGFKMQTWVGCCYPSANGSLHLLALHCKINLVSFPYLHTTLISAFALLFSYRSYGFQVKLTVTSFQGLSQASWPFGVSHPFLLSPALLFLSLTCYIMNSSCYMHILSN